MAPRDQQQALRDRVSAAKRETARLEHELKEANQQNELKEQLCDFALGTMKAKDTELEELKKENKSLRRRLDIRERSVKQFLASTTREETTAAALEAQVQNYLEMVKGQQKDITARDEEIEELKWQYQHAKKYEACAVEAQRLIELVLAENRILEANQK